MSARQRFGHLLADSLTVDGRLSQVGDLEVNGASLWSTLDRDARVFYQDPVGGAAANIATRDAPVLTMNQALALTVADRGDVIVRMRGGEEVTETVAFNKAGVTVIAATHGLNPLAMGEYFSTYAATSFTDGPVATVTERTRIIGLGFVSRDVGTTFHSGAAMFIGVQGAIGPFGVHILGCRFPKWNLTNRMGIGVEGTSDLLIEACSFEGVGSDFAIGVYLQGACQNPEIRDCRFRDCTHAISHGAFASNLGPEAIYKSNVVQGGGKLLASNGFTAAGLITDNHLQTAVGTASFDVNYAALAALGLYASGNHYAEVD